MLQRYSPRTVKTYQSFFIQFLCFYPSRNPETINKEESYIQELLGHNSSETTEIYTHITSKARSTLCSPLDFLDI